MKITKARLIEIIQEELQSEVIGLAFAAKAKKEADKKKKQEKDSDKEKLQKEGSYGGDGQMADSQLNTIVELATKLDMIISDDTKIPNWVKSKITKSLDYISTSLNYLIGEIADAQEEMIKISEGNGSIQGIDVPNKSIYPQLLKQFAAILQGALGPNVNVYKELINIAEFSATGGKRTPYREGLKKEEKLTKPQIKDRDKRAKKIMKSTKKQYGKEEGEDIAYAIATNQVKEET